MVDGLYKAYFIGGEWDGVSKRVQKEEFIKVIKHTTMYEKVKYFGTNETSVTRHVDMYVLVTRYNDDILIYRLLKNVKGNN